MSSRRFLFALGVLGLLLVPGQAAAAAPTLASSTTITGPDGGRPVATEVSPNLLDIPLRSAAIGERATAQGNGVRVLLPKSYGAKGSEGKRYPVMYLLMGTGGWSFRSWSNIMSLPDLVGDSEVIIVTPDPGKNSWYTDWVDQRDSQFRPLAQRWETFYLDQMIPWVDANFRTIAKREGRALVGYSMGGFGAMHFATARKDMFGVVSSMSGAVDIEDPLIRTFGVEAASLGAGFQPYGAFTNLLTPSVFFNPISRYMSQNPMRHLGQLRDTKVYLQSAIRTEPGLPNIAAMSPQQVVVDVIAVPAVEAANGGSTLRMHASLDAQRIAHTYRNWGSTVSINYGTKTATCAGGHTAGCFTYQTAWVFPQILKDLAPAR